MEKIPEEKMFWAITPEETADIFNTNIEGGLSQDEANIRLEKFGRNSIEEAKKTTSLKILFNQLKSPLILILIFAGIITLFISHYRDAVFIFIAVVVNSILGFYQENKAEKALSELKSYLKQRSRVIRDGVEREVDSEEIVPGDLVRLSQGDRVPADARIVYTNDFQVDESILTGESLPVIKNNLSVDEVTSLSDQVSMIFAGTLVTQGVGVAIVCRTDAHTELGKIASVIAETRNERTPLQKAIADFSIKLSLILGMLTILVFIIGIFSGYSFLNMFLTAVAIAVSAIPEGLPVSMTVILAVGVERMAKRKGVVRKLVAAEALGSTTVILTDKTGTLTMARMILSKIIPTRFSEEKLLSLALVNANVLIENPNENPEQWRMSGRIMETALVRSAALKGHSLKRIMDKKNIHETIPFNAVQKYSASLVKEGDRYHAIFFGAPDILLEKSSLTNDQKREQLSKIEELAFGGERVLGVATKEIPEISEKYFLKDLPVSKLNFEGVITFRDPVRPGIKDTIRRVMNAGIKTVILTGDHRGTAMSVAKEIGIDPVEGSVLDASELIGLSDEDLKRKLPNLRVIARVTPFDKLKIAKLFQASGEIVAMTGDGVNDAPSIKQADIGIAMGSGTEVAQSVADLVLLDDNFETIVAAVEEGRHILANIKKVLIYLLSNVTDGLILIGGSLLTGLPLPLNALQILWVNFFSDSFPAIAYAFEAEPDVLSKKPARNKIQLFDPLMKFLILVIGISTSLLLFIVYYCLLKLGFNEDLVRTFIFASFGTYTLLLAFSVRSLDKSIFKYPLLSNKYLTGGVAIGLVLMAVAIYIPMLQRLFGTVSLPFVWVIGVFGIGFINILLIEVAKYFFRIRSPKKSYHQLQ